MGLISALMLSLAGPSAAAEEKIIVSHAISQFGTPELPADFPHLPYVNPEAPKGGTLSQHALGGFDSMNPFSVQGRAAMGSSMMLESILTSTADEIDAYYCLLCTTMEYPEDRSWVIFNLREDVRFSDGTPLTAEDVLFSFETFMTKGLADYRTLVSREVTGAEILGPHRIKFTFAPDAPLREMIQTVGDVNVFSKAQFERENRDLEASSMVPFIGSGPYVVDKIDPGRSISYRRNPDYWGKDLPINRGRHNFDVLSWEYFNESNAAFEGFKAGLYHVRRENIARIWAQQYDFPAVRKGHVRQEVVPTGAKASGQAMVFNLRRPHLQDPRVREAIGRMFNFEWTNRSQFFGLYQRVNSYWENSWLAAEGPTPPEEAALLKPLVEEGLLPESILTEEPFSYPVSNEKEALDRRQLRVSARLLEEAGWTPGPDGLLRNARGEVLKLELLETNQSFERILAPFVENLRALGIDARLSMIDSAQYEVRTRNPAYDFDLTSAFNSTGYLPSSGLKQYFGSETADISAFNVGGLKSPAVDRMIDLLLSIEEPEAIDIATRALDRVMRAERFSILEWHNPDAWLAYYDYYEHPERLPKFGTGLIDTWWVNAEKLAALKAAGAVR